MQTVRDIQEIEKAVKQNGGMIVVKNTDNNEIAIMSLEEYDKIRLEEDIEKGLLEAEDDIKNGRVYDIEKVFEEWDKKYGV